MARHYGRLLIYDSQPAALVAALRARGYMARVARDEPELDTIASLERPDLVVGDLEAATSTPVGVCRRLKSSLLLRHLPVVVVTRRGDVASRVAALDSGADDCVVTPCDEGELLARINRAISRARASLDANPLTCLPGNASIKAEIDERLARHEAFAVLLIDLDNFKAFNDRYGFDRGDEALRVLSNIVLQVIHHTGNGHRGDFVGHIGGDDFVAITSVDHAEACAAHICQLVDHHMPLLYDEADRQRGSIASTDRRGRRRRFRLMTVAVAIVTNEHERFRHHSQFSQIGSEIKRYLKQLPGSRYMTNRRRRASAPAAALAASPAPVAAPS